MRELSRDDHVCPPSAFPRREKTWKILRPLENVDSSIEFSHAW